MRHRIATWIAISIGIIVVCLALVFAFLQQSH